jgi:hypothetical protein
MTRACLEHIAYGEISPNIVMMLVDKIKPVHPDVRSPIKILMAELTVTLPSRMVQSKKLPLLLKGRIFAAYLASLSSSSLLNGPLVISSRFLTSSPSSPKFNPEKIADSEDKKTMARICHHST